MQESFEDDDFKEFVDGALDTFDDAGDGVWDALVGEMLVVTAEFECAVTDVDFVGDFVEGQAVMPVDF